MALAVGPAVMVTIFCWQAQLKVTLINHDLACSNFLILTVTHDHNNTNITTAQLCRLNVYLH